MNTTLTSSRTEATDCFQQALDINPDDVHILDHEGFLVHANKSFFSRFGYSKSDLGQLHISSLDAQFSPEFIQNAMESIAYEGYAQTFFTKLRCKTGEVINVQARVSPTEIDGKLHYFGTSICMEGVENRQQTPLPDSAGNTPEEWFDQFIQKQTWFDQAVEGICILNLDGSLLECSPSFLKLLGYEKTEASSLNVNDWEGLYSEKQIEELFTQLSPEPLRLETVHIRKDGSRYDAEVTVKLVLIGGRHYVFSSTRDLTYKRQLLKQKDDAIKALNAKIEEQERIFSIIGHELRTPAAALHLMLDEKSLDRAKLKATSSHLLAVLDDMRAIVQPEAMLEKKCVQASLHDIITSATSFHEKMLQESGIALKVQTDLASKDMIMVNAQLIRQITLNMIRNCSLHSGASSMEITASQVEGHPFKYLVTYEDNGKGIPPEVQASLFSAFARGGNSVDGTGLGLHISKKFAEEQLHGNLVYKPSALGGARFELIMDLSAAQTNAQLQVKNKQIACAAKGILAGKNILVAEDNELIRMLTTFVLEEHGAQVVLAKDGVEALELIHKRPYDLLITDISMPNMDGIELTRQLRMLGKTLPIFALTAAVLGTETLRIIEAGANQSLTKPIDIEQIEVALHQFLNQEEAIH